MVGHGLHFRADHRKPGTAYLMFPCLDPHFEFDTEFDKTLKNQCFSPFPPHQKSPHSSQKSLKPLKNKASIELDQKSQNFLKNLHKISKKSLYKFLFFLSKIRHFIILTKSKNTFPPNSHIYNVKNPNGEYISVTKNLLFFKWRKLYGNTRNMERYSRI